MIFDDEGVTAAECESSMDMDFLLIVGRPANPWNGRMRIRESECRATEPVVGDTLFARKKSGGRDD